MSEADKKKQEAPAPQVSIGLDVLEKLLSRVTALESAVTAPGRPTAADIDLVKQKYAMQETPAEREARRPEDARILADIRKAHAQVMHKVNRKYKAGTNTILYNDRSGG